MSLAQKSTIIIIYSLCVVSALYFIEQSIGVSYILKTILKICLFLIIPLAYAKFITPNTSKKLLARLSVRQLLPGVCVGIFSFVAIMLAYVLLKQQIDLTSITQELQNKLGITALNFILVGIYITVVNSLLEEYFFRNFIFLNLFKDGRRYTAYIFSSLLFALYHMAIFAQWFRPSIIALCLLGLFLIGLVYSYINSKHGHFLNSWIAHACADVAIILIGLKMFGIL